MISSIVDIINLIKYFYSKFNRRYNEYHSNINIVDKILKIFILIRNFDENITENRRIFTLYNNKIISNFLFKKTKVYIKNKGKTRFLIKKERLFYHLIIFILISIFIKSKCKRIIELKESIVTLRVSVEEESKVFYDSICNKKPFTKPSKVYIDEIEKSVKSKYILNPDNIVKLVWENDITECQCMFKGCSSIVEMNFSNFNTKCNRMIDMFRGCIKLKSLDLSNFDVSSIIEMSNMFMNCWALTFLDLSNFDTSKTINMGHMFANCKSLTSLNISHFNTSILQYTDYMFNGCESLKILDFSNFDSSNLKLMDNMFINCKNLEYINLKNYKTSTLLNNNFFKGTPENFVVCTDNIDLINIRIKPECNIVDCSDNWKNNRKKINTENNICTDDCYSTNYKFEYIIFSFIILCYIILHF